MEESKVNTNDFLEEKSVNYKLNKIGTFIQISKIKKLKKIIILSKFKI